MPAFREVLPNVTPIERRNMNLWEDDAVRRDYGYRNAYADHRGHADGGLRELPGAFSAVRGISSLRRCRCLRWTDTSNNAEILRDIALAGGGIGLLPDWLVDDDIDSGRLTALFDPWSVNPDQASSAISALYLPNQRGSRRIAAFLEFLATLQGPTRRQD